VATHPSGKFVYVTNGGNPALGVNGPSLAASSINANTGALTRLSSFVANAWNWAFWCGD
jgi:hypothetical protein